MVCAGYVESSCRGWRCWPRLGANSCPGGIVTAKGKASRPGKKKRIFTFDDQDEIERGRNLDDWDFIMS